MQAQRGDGGTSPVHSNPALEGGRWISPPPSRFTPGERPSTYCTYRLGWPRGRSARVRKISPSLEFDPRTVQHISSCHTDYAFPAAKNYCLHRNLQVLGIWQILVYVLYKKKAVWCADGTAGRYAYSFGHTGMVVMCSKYVSWNILLLHSAYRRSDCFCSYRCARLVLKWKLLQQWKPYSDSQGTVGFFKERTASVGFM
jgi:hypothetical protein